VNGVLTQGFLYSSQLRPVAELDGTGNLLSRFVYGTKVNVPEYMIKGGTTYRLLTDHLGSVRLVLDTASGALAQRIDYDEFGQILQDTNPGFQPFGFAGGLHDLHTKLTHFGARDYDPFTGRWTRKDPIRFAGGDANLYKYLRDNPILLSDPLGLQGGYGLPEAVTISTTVADIVAVGAAAIAEKVAISGPGVVPLAIGVAADVVGYVGAGLLGPELGIYGDIIGLGSSAIGTAATTYGAAAATTVTLAGTLSVTASGLGLGYTVGTLTNKYVLNNPALFPGGNPVERKFRKWFFDGCE
jgi:RHS repeat-associated protein